MRFGAFINSCDQPAFPPVRLNDFRKGSNYPPLSASIPSPAMKLFSLLLTLFITCASAQDTQPKPDTDWEGALADYMQAKGQAEIVGLWVTLQRPDPAVARKRWDFFAAQFPTSSSTAKLASTRCAELVEAKRWDELLTAVTELVRRHPDYPSTHGPAIAAVEKIVTKAEVPDRQWRPVDKR